MKTRRVNGLLFEKMLLNGLANIRLNTERINDLNVFPVADGDTGTNMSLTLENGLRAAKRTPELGAYLKGLSEGMLFGARGNSGVILSQIFNGIFQSLAHCSAATPGDLRNAFIRGYKVAYDSVVCPVEGTILTVAREGIEHIRNQIDRSTTVETLLSIYIAEMKKTLAYTPELLPVLKESGVVDSGGAGYIVIVEGMLKYLYGEILKSQRGKQIETAQPTGERSMDAFDENSPFEYGYCMEFILQLMADKKYTQRFILGDFVEDLKHYGNSLVVTQNGKRVKVHIHTFRPAKIITACQEYGEFLTFKLENMQLQHNEHQEKLAGRKEHKTLAVVTVADGEGLRSVFRELGCDCVLDGGPTMNTSSREFVDAFAQLDADAIVVLPNNKNIVRAAEQAVALSGAENIFVIPTASVAEGYCALSMDIPDSGDVQNRLRQMRSGAESMLTLSVTTATRDYAHGELVCKAGEKVAILQDAPVAAAADEITALTEGLRRIEELSDKECCVVFLGQDAAEADEDAITQAVASLAPCMELTFFRGGQSLYRWILGVF